ncbi:CvpA family protein [Virgibacillus sp. 179-BFC.A HS]|uniref:CvpA family protein n=1 Tax=Tigheibacillus jepli TaxID=3035914 RepID=A0ABU5CGJ9_9BACI|nr:CvpA family protein [Virgibacillus sp. 179-BFC.A HS]MDY0405406.1 CvpA family protein [Virgibacillus sp. 179-BFC.A HS]
MVSLLLIILLLFGFFMGMKRGLVLQMLHFIGFIISFVLAAMYYDDLASKLSMWIPYPNTSDPGSLAAFLQSAPVEQAFYNAVSFAIIFFAVKIIVQIIASMLDFVASLPILHSVNKLLGAVFGFLEVYLLLFIVLFILALTPVDSIQHWVNNSSVALFIIEDTPYLSGKIQELWFAKIDSIMHI